MAKKGYTIYAIATDNRINVNTIDNEGVEFEQLPDEQKIIVKVNLDSD